MAANEAVSPNTWVPEDTFGARLALIRQAMRWNVKEAAEACGLNDQSWRNWEDGKRCRDLLEVAQKIATATGIDPTWIVMGAGPGPGSRIGSFATSLLALPDATGQTTLFGEDLDPLDFYGRPELELVGAH